MNQRENEREVIMNIREEVQKVLLCDNNLPFQEMIRLLISKFRKLQACNQNVKVDKASSENSIHKLLQSAMEWYGSLVYFTCSVDSFEEMNAQAEQDRIRCESLKQKEREMHAMEEKMKKDAEYIQMNLELYIQNMNDMKKHVDEDQHIIARLECQLHSLSEQVSLFLQIKGVLKELCTEMLQRIQNCNSSLNVYPEFYSLKMIVEDLDQVLKDLDGSEEKVDILEECIENPKQETNEYERIYDQLNEEKYELLRCEHAIIQYTTIVNRIGRRKEEKIELLVELRSLILRLYEELAIIVEDIAKEESNSEKSFILINRIVEINSLLQARSKQAEDEMKRIEELNESYCLKKGLLSQLVQKRELQKVKINELTMELKHYQECLTEHMIAIKKEAEVAYLNTMKTLRENQPVTFSLLVSIQMDIDCRNALQLPLY